MDLMQDVIKYCINRGRFVSVDASIKSDAKTGASERKRPFNINKRASRRDNMIEKKIMTNCKNDYDKDNKF